MSIFYNVNISTNSINHNLYKNNNAIYQVKDRVQINNMPQR